MCLFFDPQEAFTTKDDINKEERGCILRAQSSPTSPSTEKRKKKRMRKEENKERKKKGMEGRLAGKMGGRDGERKKTNENFPQLTKARNRETGDQEAFNTTPFRLRLKRIESCGLPAPASHHGIL